MFFDVRDVLKDNCVVNMIVGKRNTGKTYSTVHYAWEDVIEQGYHFIYLRRHKQNELDIAKDKVFDSVPESTVTCKGYKYFRSVLDEEGKETKEECGYALALSSLSGVKGIGFSKVKLIIFDEFTITFADQHYLKDEFGRFASLLETVMRVRPDVKVIMLGNAYNFYNPYVIGWNIRLGPGQLRWTSPDKLVTYRELDTTKYGQERDESVVAQLFANTNYEKWAGNNLFVANTGTQIRKKTAQAWHYFNLKTNEELFNIWVDKSGMYVAQNNLPHNVTYNFDKNNLADGDLYFRRQRNEIQRLRMYFSQGCLYYESEKIKTAFLDILSFIVSY